MTYNWNTMVEITVPTGTNGWLYSGEVIINGVKVRFPVGVPTSVPEPAAVLLKKMIELEQEEDANTAKPQNHYVGDVTIPAGKTLTLEKGAKFVDNSGPSEVVILPETELTVLEIIAGDAAAYALPTPFENAPVAGGTYKLIWGGVEYISKAADITEIVSASQKTLLMGNSDMMGVTDAIGTNLAPDAPFFFLFVPDGSTADGMTVYGLLNIDANLATDPPTLSIVQTEGAASGGESAGGGIFEVNVPVTKYITSTGHDFGEFDKSFAEIVAAHNAGKYVRINAGWNIGYSTYGYVIGFGKSDGQDTFIVSMPASPTIPKQVAVYMLYAGDDGKIAAQIMAAD